MGLLVNFLVLLLAVFVAFVVMDMSTPGGMNHLSVLAYFYERTDPEGKVVPLASFTAEEVSVNATHLSGKIAIVTGANAGIGLETARVLALHGMNVIMACRNMKKCMTALKEIESEVGSLGTLECLEVDLSDLLSVHSFAEKIKSRNLGIYTLIHNAAVVAPEYQESAQGVELMYAVNVLAPHYLTNLLLPDLQKVPKSRVIFVSSFAGLAFKKAHLMTLDIPASKDNFDKTGFYAFAPGVFAPLANFFLTKLAEAVVAYQFNQRFRESDVSFVVVHPGIIKTALLNEKKLTVPEFLFHVLPTYTDAWGITRCLKTVPQGASTTVWTVVNDVSGSFYHADNMPHDDSTLKYSIVKDYVNDKKLSEKLWNYNENLIKRMPGQNIH